MENKYSDLAFSLSLDLYPAVGVIMTLPWIDVANKKIWERAATDFPPTDGFYLGDWSAGLVSPVEGERVSNMFDNHFDGFCGYFDIFYTTLDDRGKLWDYLASLDADGAAMIEVEVSLTHLCCDEDKGHIFDIGSDFSSEMFYPADFEA
jgi:hypothetical protein